MSPNASNFSFESSSFDQQDSRPRSAARFGQCQSWYLWTLSWRGPATLPQVQLSIKWYWIEACQSGRTSDKNPRSRQGHVFILLWSSLHNIDFTCYIFIRDCPARDPVGLDSDLQNLGILSPTIVPAWLAKVSSKWSWTYTSGKFSWRHTWWQSNASSISNSSHCYLIANMLLIHLAPAVFSPPLPNSGYLSPWGMSGSSSIGLTSRSALPLWHSESTVPCTETPCLAISAADKLCIGIQCLQNLTGDHAGQR